MSNALSKKEEAALAAYSYTATETHDELDMDSYAIPRIAVLEKMSPQVDQEMAEYIEGAKPGMLCNSVMGELYTNILAIPVKRRRVYLEWTPRNLGGGFVAEHNVADGAELMELTTRNEKNVDITPNGTELHNVLEFYVLFSADSGQTWRSAIMSMSRTRMSEGKKWNSRIDQFVRGGQRVTPLAQVYDISTARRERDSNVSYMFKVGNGKFLPDVVTNDGDVFAQAKAFLEAIDSGKASVDREAEASGSAAPADDDVVDF